VQRNGTWSKAGSRWTHDLVGYALDRFHCRHLRTPTLRELKAGIGDLPSYATIKRMYGTSSRMLSRHGYRTRRPGGQPGAAPSVKRRDPKGRFLPN
jgi:hypothetical protein